MTVRILGYFMENFTGLLYLSTKITIFLGNLLEQRLWWRELGDIDIVLRDLE